MCEESQLHSFLYQSAILGQWSVVTSRHKGKHKIVVRIQGSNWHWIQGNSKRYKETFFFTLIAGSSCLARRTQTYPRYRVTWYIVCAGALKTAVNSVGSVWTIWNYQKEKFCEFIYLSQELEKLIDAFFLCTLVTRFSCFACTAVTPARHRVTRWVPITTTLLATVLSKETMTAN